jgi:hypothetical protein
VAEILTIFLSPLARIVFCIRPVSNWSTGGSQKSSAANPSCGHSLLVISSDRANMLLVPEFDENIASQFLGKYILVGATYLNHDGSLNEQVQMYGMIESASHEGFRISLRGARQGESWTMPPVREAIQPAKPGRYSLRASGEVIEDPDFLSTWTVNKPHVS